ncbi:NAD(P)H-binding protein [Methylobacterium sp. J-078]|uniref:NAD(P)H-binding protein n=1 Tax=Methylobacterium sp. J-078 TaxID=2836657 RepID=UPI001FBAF13E|nr:NAD(P)H-binding protein [Methylobacterium sp. J-078]MCJ2044027.1 NAD(P)H-binding protein [Methylobacterium sp. J-078]
MPKPSLNVFIVGDSGKVVRRLARMLGDNGHVAKSLHRKPEQAEGLAALGAMVVQSNLTEMSIDALAALMASSDAVFSAGQLVGLHDRR